MTEKDADREHEEVLCAYVLQKAGFTDDEREALTTMEWDPIAPELVVSPAGFVNVLCDQS